MKILCISVHPVLEYDDILLFESLGHDIFCLGFYFSRTTENNLRPALNENDWHRECREAFVAEGCKSNVPDGITWQVTEAFSRRFDVILVHHNFRFIGANWEALKQKPVIWRTIGQEGHWAEDAMREYRRSGVKIVRWSLGERDVPGYIGEDAVIRAYKDPNVWTGWDGLNGDLVTFNNNFQSRGDGLSFDFYEACTSGFPRSLYGLGNENLPGWKGLAAYETQKSLLQKSRICFATGSIPASYTLSFIEAWMTGIPLIHVGRRHFTFGKPYSIFEVDQMIAHGFNGIVAEEVFQTRSFITEMLGNDVFCKDLSKRGREAAIAYFGKDRIASEWAQFFHQNL